MLRKIRIFGITLFEIETQEEITGAPDFTSTSHPVGFVDTRVLPLKPEVEEEVDRGNPDRDL